MTARAPLAVVAGLVLALAGTACGSDDSDDGGNASAATATTTTTTTTTTPISDTRDGTGAGSGSQLDRRRSDAASDLVRRVSETLSDLEAEVRDDDTVVTLPEQVLFDFDQHVLLPEAAGTLGPLAEAIAYFEGAPVRVAGHTDAKGTSEYNQTLSQRRAQAVVDHLVGAGVAAGRITTEGFGETRPVAPNEKSDGSDNPEGRARNRRVEVVMEGVDPADIGR